MLPFVIGGALLQPPDTEVVATLVALLLLVGSLAVSFGADLATEGAGDGRFELRRLVRGALALVVLGGVLFGTAQVGFLFPPPTAQDIVPPMRPPTPPAAADRVLFTVSAPAPTTWRLGTLDVYDGTAWLTPPFDASTLVPVNGNVPTAPGDTRGPLPAPGITATIEVADLPGKALPGLANPLAVRGGPQVEYDPRTQALRTAGVRLPRGTTYEVLAPAPPTGAVLSRAGRPAAAARPFLDVPSPPAEIAALLAEAPTETFARLQFVRRAYFAKVVAAGAGNPVDVPPSRVVEMLAGKEATPYEITAGEVLLARWAGVPARIGYGWFGGDKVAEGRWEIRPRNGSTWLEAYFEGSGWVPIVGTPPRARASTAAGARNDNPSVRPTDELALVVYVPVELSSTRLAYVLVRYYALRSLPFLLGIGLLAAFYPALIKVLRRTARRRAAARLGPRARIAAAYAELRDNLTDLGIAGPAVTPLELLGKVDPDAEHRELAWLVTRSLWGDLSRDLQPGDVAAAQTLSLSVARRLRSAQPGLSRATALASRASLSNPWTDELPTLWKPRRSRKTAVAGRPKRFAQRVRAFPARAWPPRPVPLAVLGSVLVVAVAVLVAVTRPEPTPPALRALPDRVAPGVLGDIRLVREQSAEKAFREGTDRSLAREGRVFSLRQGDVVQGSLQVAALDPTIDTRSPRIRDQVLQGLGKGGFRASRIGQERVYRLALPELDLLLSFTPDGHGYYLMAARAAYADSDRLFASVLAFTRGEAAAQLRPADVVVPDPRTGSAS
ncbi:MAG: transglutaminase domain-containing protein [Frankiales bacterium]|nr:transglutaminase domain-containing protein [Frankiales bacterium]